LLRSEFVTESGTRNSVLKRLITHLPSAGLALSEFEQQRCPPSARPRAALVRRTLEARILGPFGKRVADHAGTHVYDLLPRARVGAQKGRILSLDAVQRSATWRIGNRLSPGVSCRSPTSQDRCDSNSKTGGRGFESLPPCLGSRPAESHETPGRAMLSDSSTPAPILSPMDRCGPLRRGQKGASSAAKGGKKGARRTTATAGPDLSPTTRGA
jgi:hypothetical protein